MAMTTAEWQTFKPEIDMYVNDEQNKVTERVYKRIWNVETNDRLINTIVTDSGPQPMQAVGEMGDAVESEFLEAWTSNFNKLNYRQKFVFGSNLRNTDQSGEIERLARSIPNNLEYSRDLYITGELRRAWDATRLQADGSTLIAASHLRRDGGPVQANTFRDGVQRPLGYTALNDLESVMNDAVTNSGNLMTAFNAGAKKLLVVGTKNRERAFQLAKVETKPTTSDRAANYFVQGTHYDVLVTPMISWNAATLMGETSVSKTSAANFYDDMWFLIDLGLAEKYTRVFTHSAYTNGKRASKVNEENESLIEYLYDFYSHGSASWFWVAGSKADNSTVS